MKVLVTGHRGFIGQHVFADWRRELGYANVHGIDKPDCVNEMPKSSLKSIKNIPKVCLTPSDIRTTKLAAIKVIKAVLFGINLSDVIKILF